MPPRASRTARERSFTVYPPASVGPAIGGAKTRPANVALGIIGHLLGDAAVEVATLFTPDEWGVIALAMEGDADRTPAVQPDDPDPASVLASLLRQAQARYRAGDRLAKGEKGRKAMDGLVDRVASLGYVQAWAVVVAVRFVREHPKRAGQGPWWDLAFRREVLAQVAAEKEE